VPGFGLGPFGSGFFGEDYWEEHVLWEDMPERRRARDKVDNGGQDFLRNLTDSIIPSMRRLRHSIRDFFDLRDPWAVRTRYNNLYDIEIVDIEEHESDNPDERWLSVYIAGDPIEDASKSWVIESQDVAFKRWVVERVYKLDSSPTAMNDNWRVVIKGTENPPVVGETYSFHPQEQIVSLGADYGEEIDQYFTEERQRSQIIHHDQRRMWKGTQTGYENQCKLYGFTVTLTHLFRVRCGFETTVAGWGYPVYEIPVGSGHYYTSYAPRRPKFDEIAGDAIPLDTFCDRPEFTSVIPLGPFVVSSATAFTAPYAGWEVLLAAAPGALDPITWPGHWYIAVPDGSGGFFNYYLESIPEYIGPGLWRVMISGSGTAPSGAVNIGYACPVWLDCCFCGTHKISVDLTLTAPSCTSTVTTGCLTDREKIYVTERVIDALYDRKPIHVEFARFALHILAGASFDMKAHMRKAIRGRLVAGLRYRYDFIEGDAIPADTYSLTATLTV
jgi:hypothetical protein